MTPITKLKLEFLALFMATLALDAALVFIIIRIFHSAKEIVQ